MTRQFETEKSLVKQSSLSWDRMDTQQKIADLKKENGLWIGWIKLKTFLRQQLKINERN